MKLLALDAATDACSAALHCDGRLHAVAEVAPRQHVQRLLPMIDTVLAAGNCEPAQLDAIAFGCGPGSFTGVRIATSLAHGLALGADVPLVPVSDLAMLAQQAFRRHGWSRVIALFDARLGQVYAGVYERDAAGNARALRPDALLDPAQLSLPDDEAWCGIGGGWALPTVQGVRAQLQQVDTAAMPLAEDAAHLAVLAVQAGEAVPVEEAQPVYLRDRVADPAARRQPS